MRRRPARRCTRIRADKGGWYHSRPAPGSSSARLECAVRDREVGSSNLPFPTASDLFCHPLLERADISEASPALTDDVVPEALTEVIDEQRRSDDDADVDADPPLLRPVHIFELQQECVLVEHQREADAEGNRQVWMPFRILEAEGEESAHRDQQQAPHVVMDVDRTSRATADDNVMEGTDVVVDRVGEHSDEQERDEKRRQETERGAFAKVEMRLSGIAQSLAKSPLTRRLDAVVATRHGASVIARMARAIA